MSMKKWVIKKADTALAKSLAEELEIDPFIALIACVRGVTDAAELEQMISPELYFEDPRELIDIEKAAKIVNGAIRDGVKIAVYGDYDCDGVVSTALMYDYLYSRGADVITYIPDRISEGYGMNLGAVDKLKEMGVGLILTVDNGVSSVEEIAYANEKGIETVVTDHHIPPDILPPAAAIVDPHRVDCPSAFKDICGAFVAYKLCCVLDDKEPEQLLYRYSDILAVATVGDVMPLVEENRSVVRAGVEKIRKNPNIGISAILNVSGVDRNTISGSKISFGITPRINAAGRMGSADRALNLLLCKDMLEALNIANEIDDDNSKRQKTEREISEFAFNAIEENGYDNDRVIVVSGNNWHMGVTGIVASRICEKYGKPAIVLSCEGDIAHGSGRSFDGFNLFDAISAVSDCLTRYGGHALAAGVSINTADIETFRKRINGYAAQNGSVFPELQIDFKLNPAAMSVDMAQSIKTLEPFGNGNKTPLFAICGVTLDRITEISHGKHLKLLCSKDGNVFTCLLFGVGKDRFCFKTGDKIDLAVNLDTNYFREEYTLSVLVRAIRMSGIDEDCLFSQKQVYEDFSSGIISDTAKLLPTREDIGIVYRLIRNESISFERLKYLCAETLGYAKTKAALKVLSELELIKCENGNYVTYKTVKAELTNSATYKLLLGGESV